MPPPTIRPTPTYTPPWQYNQHNQQVQQMQKAVSVPQAVKNALLRRLRSPFGGSGLPDRSSSPLSVRERVAAFDKLSVTNISTGATTPSLKQQQQQYRGLVDVRSPSPRVGSELLPPPYPLLGTPSRGRTRVQTERGFISVGSPAGRGSVRGSVRSVASGETGGSVGRSASPALSHTSGMSIRVQSAIMKLEGESSVKSMKRMAGDEFMSPTKRPRNKAVEFSE
ncbi:hypothetical protein GGF37_002421 [Kickxella alabastrina]|nr:hypothetical protein GGF37_002421 [Kickxella alabastrina]